MKGLLLLAVVASAFTGNASAACFSEKLGYSCCSAEASQVYYTDADGDWGVENGQWCGIGDNCWAEALGYECCKDSNAVTYFEDSDGKWGVENDNWCGIIEGQGQPDQPDQPDQPKVDYGEIPEKPSLVDISTVKDPAAHCNISDSITGDSLAKSAPYRFGVGLNGGTRENATVMSQKMRDIIEYQFNSVTYSNLMKNGYLLDQGRSQQNARNGDDMPVVTFTPIVDGLEFCKEKGIKMRGHVLVWHVQSPDWFFRENFADQGNYVSSDKMEKRLESYMRQVFGFLDKYYPGVVDVWDVVNEAVEETGGNHDTTTGWLTRTKYEGKDNPWYKTMGADYVIKSFRLARKYAPAGTKLIYNDYNTFVAAKNAAIIKLIDILKAENLVDGIGMQSYLNSDWPQRKDYKNAILNFAKTGLEIQITELTLRVDHSKNGDAKFQYQAEQYKEVFQIYKDCMAEGAKITSVTVFGIQDGYLFYDYDGTDNRLWDHDLQKKPVYNSIMSVLKA